MNNVKECIIKLNEKYNICTFINKDTLYPLVKSGKYNCVEDIPMEEIIGIVRIKEKNSDNFLTEVFLCNNEIDDEDIYNSHDIVCGLLGILNDNNEYTNMKVLYFILMEKDTVKSITKINADLTVYKI